MELGVGSKERADVGQLVERRRLSSGAGPLVTPFGGSQLD